MNLTFAINNIDATITLSALRTPIAGSLAANIDFVQFDVAEGGRITYNDRPPIPEAFTDPTPYASFVNQWITAKAAASPALTLAQAMAVKTSLVDAIFSGKRQLPVTATVTAGTYQWDVSDDVMAQISAPLANQAYSDLLATLGSMRTALNQWATNIGTNQNATQAGLSTLANQINTAINNARATGNGDAVYLDFAPASMSVALGTTTTNALAALPVAPATTPIKMIPVGQTSLVTLSFADVQAIISAAAVAAGNLQTVNAAKRAAIAALSTVADVAAYDVTTGW